MMNVKPLQQSEDHGDWLHVEKTKISLKKASDWASMALLSQCVGAKLAYEELNFFNKHGNDLHDF
jgi:hypothetical protein